MNSKIDFFVRSTIFFDTLINNRAAVNSELD